MEYMSLVLSLLAIIPAAYYFYLFRRLFKTLGLNADSRPVIASVILLTLIAWHFCAHLTGAPALFLYMVLVTEMIVHLIDQLFKRLLFRCFSEKFRSIWNKVFGLLIIPVLATIIIFICGYQKISHVVETHYTVTTEKETESDLRVCFLADVHCGNVLGPDDYDSICREISGKNIDVLIIGGDLIDYASDQETAERAIKAFGSISTSIGSFYVFGNHDRVGDYKESVYTEDWIIEQMEASGINVLQDQVIPLIRGISLVGREDADTSYGRIRKPAEEVFCDVDTDDFIIVADHQPSEYQLLTSLGADLILGGHLHGGQIFPVDLIVRLVHEEHVVSGRYLITGHGNMKQKPDGPATQGPGTATAIVTSGFIGWTYPVRTINDSEYCIIDIQKQK